MSYAGAAIGAVMGGLKSASKGTGKNLVESLVKNPALQSRLDATLGGYDTTSASAQQGLDQYIKDFLAGNKTATANTGQETAAIDRYYNGDVDRALASLRTEHAAASNEALQRALQYATHAQNLDRISSGGGDSSYNRQLALKTGTDLNLNTLLQNIAQQRADEERVRQKQEQYFGARTAMNDALAARDLVPSQAQKANLGWQIGTLSDLLRNDQANKFYGVKYKPSGFERGVDIAGGVLGGAASGAMGDLSGGGGGGGGMMGMFGGGGSSAPANPGGVNWMPSSGGWGTPTGGYGGIGVMGNTPQQNLALSNWYYGGPSFAAAPEVPSGGWGSVNEYGLINGF